MNTINTKKIIEMRNPPELVAHANLIEQIVGQFVFMTCMSEPQDSNFHALHELDLNDIFRKADAFFVDLTDEFGLIESQEKKLSVELKKFLSEWEEITDVTAIQQNVHYQLARLYP
jgi:hypothetical protein